MAEHGTELEARYAELADRLDAIERRLSALEAAPAAARARAPARAAPRAESAEADAQTVAQARADAAAVAGTVPLVGRTLLVLAGAYVLRALAEAGAVPTAVGLALGLLYAAGWLALADRAGAARATTSAGFHGVAAVLVALPLLFEVTTRFRLIGPGLAAVLLAAFTAAALGVAWRRRLEALAWIVALGGIAAATAIAAATGRLAPAAAYLVLLGVATLWASYVVDWHGLRVVPAIAANLAVAALSLRFRVDGVHAATAAQLGLMALYLGSIAARTLFLRREVLPFEIGQAAAAITVGLGGAVIVSVHAGTGTALLGAGVTALGLAAYTVAFAFAERPPRSRRNFAFYAGSALVLVLVGTALLLPRPMLAVVWAALAVIAAALGHRGPAGRELARPAVLGRLRQRPTLAAHAAVFAAAGAFASGLLAHAAQATLGSPGDAWTRTPAAAIAVLAAMGTAAWLGTDASARSRLQRAPRVALIAVLAAGVAGVAIGWLAPFFGMPGQSAASEVAALRTVVLVALALALALVGRVSGWTDAAALAYPALALIGLKIGLEDLPRGQPATQLVAFACYGAALIAVARLRRGHVRPVRSVGR